MRLCTHICVLHSQSPTQAPWGCAQPLPLPSLRQERRFAQADLALLSLLLKRHTPSSIAAAFRLGHPSALKYKIIKQSKCGCALRTRTRRVNLRCLPQCCSFLTPTFYRWFYAKDLEV